ncbi:MAG: uroporphyrinogen-III C-methyltransferase, partial [Gammaproteobacteria bacterium]|nr:uroporphyrinogen-III C-methyltransferase [Gammaproteobacteria bacterium]
PTLAALARGDALSWRARGFEPADLDGARIAIAATDDPATNAAVARAARAAGIPVNVADAPELSTFIVPAIVDRSPLVIAVTSGGTAPLLATRVRERIEAELDESWGQLARFAGRWRDRIRAATATGIARWNLYDWLLAGPVAAAIRAGHEAEAERLLGARLTAPAAPAAGFVSLVGAGPGDPDLLTLAALHALQRADVILADRLPPPQVLARARRDAEIIDVGKRPGDGPERQAAINELLVEHARRGRWVVRLKGGDPLVFGRGGEELRHLRAAGIAYEIVPGVTAALACAAHAGIPLTHREHASALQLVTAHGSRSIDDLDWTGLARPGQTLAFYMASRELARVSARLIGAGLAPDTPAAVVENGTLPEQRVLVTDLERLPAAAERHALQSPAMLFVGAAAASAAELHWFGAAPLSD